MCEDAPVFVSGWRAMWLFAIFDLPQNTKQEKKAYSEFRQRLLTDGFMMMQYSVYIRFCVSREHVQVHIDKMKRNLPPKGKVQFMSITDKQFGRIQTYWGKWELPAEETPSLLEFF
jgi:CRISPR-associated protein Cas2